MTRSNTPQARSWKVLFDRLFDAGFISPSVPLQASSAGRLSWPVSLIDLSGLLVEPLA